MVWSARIPALFIGAGLSLSAPAVAQESEIGVDSYGFMEFQDVCLRDEGQFAYAKQIAVDMWVATEPAKSALLDNREGEVWVANKDPMVSLMAFADGGCGVYIKPVREDYLNGFLGAIPGQDIVHSMTVKTAWGRWYIINTDGLHGVLSAWFFDLNGEKSIDLRYTPAGIILSDDRAIDYLRLEPAIFEKVRGQLRVQ